MNTPSHKHPIRKGFTLLEMTVVLVIGLMIAGMTTSLFTQQLSMFNILRSQNFMLREAPKINSLLNNIVSRADAIRMYADTTDAKSASNSATDGATVIALKFQGSSIKSGQSVLSESYGVIAFDSTTGKLNYYGNLDSLASLDPANPDWQLSNQVQDVAFSVTNGVLRIQLTGPNGGEINYSTTPL
jgi:prepilin-type N-terminal cleavage/methylation domain-containing protein